MCCAAAQQGAHWARRRPRRSACRASASAHCCSAARRCGRSTLPLPSAPPKTALNGHGLFTRRHGYPQPQHARGGASAARSYLGITPFKGRVHAGKNKRSRQHRCGERGTRLLAGHTVFKRHWLELAGMVHYYGTRLQTRGHILGAVASELHHKMQGLAATCSGSHMPSMGRCCWGQNLQSAAVRQTRGRKLREKQRCRRCS